MYKNKIISLSITSCKRIHLLTRVLKAFTVFCEDFENIDNVIFIDDSSSDEDKVNMEKILYELFPNKNIIIQHFYQDSFPDNYRHSRVLNHWRDELIRTNTEYCFHLEDDYLFVDFFNISKTIDVLEDHSEYGLVNFSQSYKKFPENIKPKIIGDYWEWYYDKNLPLNCNLFMDDVGAIQTPIPDFWMTYINWPSFSLRPGVHNVNRLLSIGEFSTSYDTENMRTELEFALRWSEKFKSLCHKRFHIINLAMDSSNSAYTINNSQ
jgi:hypothetical protein